MDKDQNHSENWARTHDVVNLLSYMLAFPHADHSTAAFKKFSVIICALRT